MTEEGGGGASRSTDPAAGSSAATDVSLREYWDAIRRGDEGRGRERLAWMIACGFVVWQQIQRRLEILNHENARVANIAEKTVSGDTYKSDEDRRSDERAKLDSWRKEVDSDRGRAVTREELKQDTRRDRALTINSTTAILMALASVIAVSVTLIAIHWRTNTTVVPPTTITVPATNNP